MNFRCDMNRAVIYARVSSVGERQNTERQVADLTRYAEASGMEVVAVYEEQASGARTDRERLAECLAFLKGGGADTLLVSELSRLLPCRSRYRQSGLTPHRGSDGRG